MLNVDKLRNEFLTDLKKIAEEGLRKYSVEIDKEIEQKIPTISTDLWRVMDELCRKYKAMEEIGEVGKLEWIYISYLRTGWIDQSSCYQIDFYDSRNCISETECAAQWNFDYIFDCCSQVKKRIMERVEKQTRFKSYEADKILDTVSEYFRKIADVWIPKLIEQELRNQQGALLDERNVKIMLGEFLDQSELITETVGRDKNE